MPVITPDTIDQLMSRLRALLDEPDKNQQMDSTVGKMNVIDVPGGQQMMTPNPPQFRPEPNVMGSPQLARMVYQVMQQNPQLYGRVGDVQQGPNASWSHILNNADDKSLKFEDSNILGLTDLRSGDMTFNPRLDKNPIRQGQIVGHEMAHAAGWRGEDKPQEAERLISALQARTGKFK